MAWLNDHLKHDWFGARVPENISWEPNVYLESSWAFAQFHSRRNPGLIMHEGSGAYGLASFSVGPEGQIEVGAFTCINSSGLHCETSIRIGGHCLISWGAIITDSVVPRAEDIAARREALSDTAADPCRRLRPLAQSLPVTIEDNVWIGFSSVVTGGVRIGRGSVVSCKTYITQDVPPYVVMAGNPARVICH